MLVEQFISFIEAEKRFSPLTVEAYHRDMEQFVAYLKSDFETDDLTQVKTTMVKSYIVKMKEEGLVNRSINRKISTLRTFYKYCLRENLIEKSPMTGIKALKQPKALVKFVTETDINKVSFGEEDDFASCRDRLLFELLYQTGMRQAELRGLKDGDVDKMGMHQYLSRIEGIIPAIESAHAVAYAMKYAKQLPKDKIMVITISGRGDKDVAAIARYMGVDIHD